MKKPTDFDLKEWLVKHSIKGLIIHHYQTGVDTADTDWELIPSSGKPKRVKAHRVRNLVTIQPDWASILVVTDAVLQEVIEWLKFSKLHAKELEEYERLKQKFGE